MGEVIVRNVAGVNGKARISLVLILTLVFSTFMYQGWYSPRQTEAAVAALNPWNTTAQINTNQTSPRTGTFTVSAGTSRLLIVAVALEYTGTVSHGVSATYGGQALTMITETTNQRVTSWVGYLNEAGIQAASSTTLSVSYNNTNFVRMVAQAAVYSGVNQSTPIAGSNSTSSGGANSLTYGSNINTTDGGYIFYVTNNENTGTSATQPGGYAEHFDTAYTDLRMSAGSKAVTATTTENQTVNFSASNRCALSVVSLNPAVPPTLSISEPNGVGDTVTVGQTYNITY